MTTNSNRIPSSHIPAVASHPIRNHAPGLVANIGSPLPQYCQNVGRLHCQNDPPPPPKPVSIGAVGGRDLQRRWPISADDVTHPRVTPGLSSDGIRTVSSQAVSASLGLAAARAAAAAAVAAEVAHTVCKNVQQCYRTERGAQSPGQTSLNC